MAQSLFDKILLARGIAPSQRDSFLNPDYEKVKHDPFLLPDMEKAVERLEKAHAKQEKIVIYGDYDIDGLTATTLLLDAFESFGFKNLDAFIPSRFEEGYGMSIGAVDKIAARGADLIVTVDCGSLCHGEIEYALELGIETIVTDHHNVADTPPPSVAAVNPKFPSHKYPFIDLAGVGVAFKLVQALQTRLPGLAEGQEKWLLDLVALGTVCDIVTLQDENRANVFWGLNVLKKQRRLGLKALMNVSGIEADKVTSTALGFGLGPRMNASGRLDSASHSLKMLRSKDSKEALRAAEALDDFNYKRRALQDKIFEEACLQADQMKDDRVLVVSSADWNHGVIGIVASKLVEKYKKPTFIISERGDKSTGSARSFGDFSVAEAISASKKTIIKGGGHGAAAGVTLKQENIPAFRESVNKFHDSLKLENQLSFLLPEPDAVVDDFTEIDEDLVNQLGQMEPFGKGNPEPVLKAENVQVVSLRKMGAEDQHVKISAKDVNDKILQFLAFNAPEHFFVEPGASINVWFQPNINEWNGNRSVEGRLLHLEANNS